jgi:hypothetical protein
VFVQIYESTKHLYASPAILHLERHLGITQLQHWDVKDAEEAVMVLREASNADVASDLVESSALRSLTAFHSALAEAIGSEEMQTAALVNAVARRIQLLEDDLERARRETKELRARRAPEAEAARKPVVTVQSPLFELETSDV